MESTPQHLETFIFLMLLCFGVGALVPLMTGFFLKRKDLLTFISLSLAMMGAIVAIWCAVLVWNGQLQPYDLQPKFGLLQKQLPAITFWFYADRLAAFFLLLTGVFTVAVVLHLTGWLEDKEDRHRIAAVFNLFVLTIMLTILADTVYSFLFFQEGMTLAFAYLALFRHNTYLEREDVTTREMEASKTAFKSYLIFEHVGIMLIAIALLVLSVQVTMETAASGKGIGSANGPISMESGLNVVSTVNTSAASLNCASGDAENAARNSFTFACFRNFHTQQERETAVSAQGEQEQKARQKHNVISSVIFLLALAGFGIKAGVFPAHVWVPMVHPYSPTSIHAMMSGIALKVAGLYGMYRFFFYFLAPIQWWWGWLVLLLAGATALFGVFYAILGKDLKTALASHSVENVGIILAGIALALIFRAEASIPPTETYLYFLLAKNVNVQELAETISKSQQSFLAGLAGLAVAASLYHLLNHSVFKGLLFFCTGAIENRTGTVALDRLGGLIKRYGVTSAAFLIGSVSIAGFPPFNGFISEWLLLQTLFAGMGVYYSRERIFLLVGLVILLFCLVLAFSLTALAFVKIAGETLLGPPRDPEVARNARTGEVRWPIRIVLLTFSALCLLLGLFPAPVTGALNKIASEVVPVPAQVRLTTEEEGMVVQVPIIEIDPQVLAGSALFKTDLYQTRLSHRMILALGLILGGSVLISLLAGIPVLRTRRVLQYGPPWICGIPFFGRMMQFSGATFASLIWKPFERKMPRPATGAARSANLEDNAQAVGPDATDFENSEKREALPYQEFVSQNRYVPEWTRRVYNFSITRLLQVCEALGMKIQPGDIRVYLRYIFLLFLCILIFLLSMTGGSVGK